MKFLDDFGQVEGGSDICNFVKYDSSKDQVAFSREALSEIPTQLSSYFYSRGVLPLKKEAGATEVPFDEDDIDDTSVNNTPFVHSFDESGTLQFSNLPEATY